MKTLFNDKFSFGWYAGIVYGVLMTILLSDKNDLPIWLTIILLLCLSVGINLGFRVLYMMWEETQ